jgi:hypothetical protein
MSDLLERLSAANPLPDCPQPSIEEVWMRLATEEPGRSRPSITPGRSRLTRRGLLVPVCAVAAVMALAVLLVTSGSGGGLSVVARAYAAASSNGTIIHYVMSSRQRPAQTNHVPWKYADTHGQVWVSGRRRHLIEALSFVPGHGSLSHEIVVDGDHVENFQGNTIVESTTQSASGSCAALVSCGAGVPADPLAEIRSLYKAGQLRAAGQTTVGHRRVDVIVSQDATVRVLVDPRTFIPIQITQTFGSQPWPVSPTVTTTITHYQRLALTPHNNKLLNLLPHPRARIACVSASGVIRVTALKHCPLVPADRPSSTTSYTTGRPPSGVRASARRYAPGRWEISVSFTASTAVTSARSSYTILLQLQDGSRLLWTSDQNIRRDTRVTEVFQSPALKFRAGTHTGTVRFNTTNQANAAPHGPDEIPLGNFEVLNPQAPASLGASGVIVGRFVVTVPSSR